MIKWISSRLLPLSFSLGHRSQTKDAFDSVHQCRCRYQHQQLEISAAEVGGGNTLCRSADSEGDSRVRSLSSYQAREKRVETRLLIIHMVGL